LTIDNDITNRLLDRLTDISADRWSNRLTTDILIKELDKLTDCWADLLLDRLTDYQKIARGVEITRIIRHVQITDTWR
jgi:hypothetical protein